MEVIVIDETHQEFNSKIYTKRADGSDYYFCGTRRLHREVWKAVNGAIPKGCDIHHVDLNKDNNSLANLQCLTKSEHIKLHRALAGNLPPAHKEIICICVYCGKEFVTYERKPDKNRFCSKKCQSAWHYRNDLVTRTCAYCGKEFKINKYAANKFCSYSCAQRNKTEGHRVKKTCPTCGKEFESELVANRKYCSLVCFKNRPRGF